MIKKIIRFLKQLLGFPPGPAAHQIGEILITMREKRDCHVAAVATACGVRYEQASKALWHWDLPWLTESPLLSNPVNVTRAIQSLGFLANDKVTWAQLSSGELPPGKVIVLVHEPDSEIKGLLNQHWVVWFGRNDSGLHFLHWGVSQDLVTKTDSEMFQLFRTGWPNCAILVTKEA